MVKYQSEKVEADLTINLTMKWAVDDIRPHLLLNHMLLYCPLYGDV
jgi:hypothetical protein